MLVDLVAVTCENEADLGKKIAKLNKPLVNRIIGHGDEQVDQLLANPLNFRLHPDNQQQALAGAIDDIGFIRSVTVNQRTGRVVDGHLRVTLAARSGVETLPVEYVDLDEAEEAQALLSLDPIAAMAGTDRDKLDELLANVQSEDERVQAMLDEIRRENGLLEDDLYTRKIVAPTYEPSGKKPDIKELFDATKADALIAEIEQSDFLSEDEKKFLIEAAKRHTVFNFSKIADYYANSDPEVQRLMENSALVIIDFQKAIENGFVQFSKGIADLFDEDYE